MMNAAVNGAIIADRLAMLALLDVLLLLKTYFDMIALRKGPDAVPSSWLVVAVSFVLLMLGLGVQMLLLESMSVPRLLPALAGYVLALGFYVGVVYSFGFARRIKQTLASIVACGSIIALVAVIGVSILAPLLGENVARVLGTLLLWWSVPVKGHIIAKSIQQHWFVGVTIAIAAFIMRLGVETAFFVKAAGV